MPFRRSLTCCETAKNNAARRGSYKVVWILMNSAPLKFFCFFLKTCEIVRQFQCNFDWDRKLECNGISCPVMITDLKLKYIYLNWKGVLFFNNRNQNVWQFRERNCHPWNEEIDQPYRKELVQYTPATVLKTLRLRAGSCSVCNNEEETKATSNAAAANGGWILVAPS